MVLQFGYSILRPKVYGSQVIMLQVDHISLSQPTPAPVPYATIDNAASRAPAHIKTTPPSD